MTEENRRRKKDSAKLVWDSKPKRAPNPRDIEFQTAEVVIPNPQEAQAKLPLFATPQAGLTSLTPDALGELPLAGQEIDKSQMNRLIWGDNLLAMQALLAQGYAGKIDLIYIDPPFLSSADYSFQLSVDGKNIDKEASILERLAYTDTWEGGIDSFLDMIYPRLQLMKRLLSDRGSIYIHIDYHISHHIRLMLDEIFSVNFFVNEIIWHYKTFQGQTRGYFARKHDNIFIYSKSKDFTYNQQFELDNLEDTIDSSRWEKWLNENNQIIASNMPTQDSRFVRYLNKFRKEKGREPYPDEVIYELKGQPIDSVWDIKGIDPKSIEKMYPTQKPNTLLERIIQASSNEGDLVADFFCGSGTTMRVAEKLDRRWIGCNLDKVGIQVSRNSLVNEQAQPFLLENIGNYQRHMIYLSGSKIGEMQRIILKLYSAEPRSDRADLGVRTDKEGNSELVYVGYPDRPTTAKKVIDLAKDAAVLDGIGYKKLVILAWDYDYNFTGEFESLKKRRNIKTDVQTLTIPPEIYNYLKKAKNEDDLEDLREKLIFHEKPYLKVSHTLTKMGDGQVINLNLERYVLMDFPIKAKTQKKRDATKAELRKIIKDNFAALIDYWAVDWDYDGITFKSMWQAMRGYGKRAETVITTATSPELPKGKRSICVRLVDIFGNDASAIFEVK